MDIVALFYDLDKFAIEFEPQSKRRLLEDGKDASGSPGQMCLSEIMTILVLFHDSNYRTFKHFYLKHVCDASARRVPAIAELQPICRTDSPCLCRIELLSPDPHGLLQRHQFHRLHAAASLPQPADPQPQSDDGLAARGKTSTGWFYGFKLHLVINDQGELLNVCFTPGNVDDRKPVPRADRRICLASSSATRDTSAKRCSSSCLAGACN